MFISTKLIKHSLIILHLNPCVQNPEMASQRVVIPNRFSECERHGQTMAFWTSGNQQLLPLFKYIRLYKES